MKTLAKKIVVEPKLARIIQKHMNASKPLDEHTRRNSRIDLSLTAKFGNGIEADIKVIDTDTGPWIDAALYDNGEEVVIVDPQYTLLKKHSFEYNGIKYVAQVC
jgi:hypothetical protein